MRVLWFTNILMPDVSQALGRPPQVVGGWMPSLLSAVMASGDVELLLSNKFYVVATKVLSFSANLLTIQPFHFVYRVYAKIKYLMSKQNKRN